MRQLRFVALAEDGAAVVLSDDNGEQYRLAVDERLQAASRGDGTRLGQIEIAMDSSMRPAEIQARVRAGEAPEEIARAGSMPVERVLRFAGPVLQERALVVQRARATRCRPLPGEEAPLLGEAVDGQLQARGVDPESATWDAGRRENGTWRISVRFGAGRQVGEAGWVYDPVGQQVRPNDDGARTLLETAPPDGAPAAAEARATEPARPLSVVREAGAVGGPAHDEPAKHVSIPSWDDIVFGVRGRKL
ncbi:MAG: septation protein SepH [Actinomycetota bacterium]|nr:septation protein SepH [Actinomycetota bacterium]